MYINTKEMHYNCVNKKIQKKCTIIISIKNTKKCTLIIYQKNKKKCTLIIYHNNHNNYIIHKKIKRNAL